MRAQGFQQVVQKGLGSKDHAEKTGTGQKRPEGNIATLAQAAGKFQGNAYDGADNGGHQDQGNECLPAEPGAQRSKQLEVAVTHAFLASRQLETPVDQPQRKIARHGTHDCAEQWHLNPLQGGCQQASPQQRKSQIIRQQGGVPVDEGQSDQNCGKETPCQPRRRRAPVLHAEEEQPRREEFDQWIAGADADPA